MKFVRQGEKDGTATYLMFTEVPADIYVEGTRIHTGLQNGDTFEVPVSKEKGMTCEASDHTAASAVPDQERIEGTTDKVETNEELRIRSINQVAGDRYVFHCNCPDGDAELCCVKDGDYEKIADVEVRNNQFEANLPNLGKNDDFCIKVNDAFSPVVNFQRA